MTDEDVKANLMVKAGLAFPDVNLFPRWDEVVSKVATTLLPVWKLSYEKNNSHFQFRAICATEDSPHSLTYHVGSGDSADEAMTGMLLAWYRRRRDV